MQTESSNSPGVWPEIGGPPMEIGSDSSTRPVLSTLVQVLKFSLLALLLWYLWSRGRLDFSKFPSVFDPYNIPFLLLLLLLLGLGQLMLAWRQKLLLADIRGRLTLGRSTRIILIGLFFNNFILGPTGGDLARLYYLNRGTGRRYSEITSFLVFDRLLGLSAMVLLALLDLFILSLISVSNRELLPGISHHQVYWLALLPLLFLSFLAVFRSKRFLDFIRKMTEGMAIGRQIGYFLSVLSTYSHKPRTVAAALGISLAGQILSIIGVSIGGFLLFGPSAFWGGLILSPLVFIASIVPVTPGNVGWTEAAAEAIWSMCGVSGGASTFILWRLMTIFFSLAGGYYYLRFKKEVGRLVTGSDDES